MALMSGLLSMEVGEDVPQISLGEAVVVVESSGLMQRTSLR